MTSPFFATRFLFLFCCYLLLLYLHPLPVLLPSIGQFLYPTSSSPNLHFTFSSLSFSVLILVFSPGFKRFPYRFIHFFTIYLHFVDAAFLFPNSSASLLLFLIHLVSFAFWFFHYFLVTFISFFPFTWLHLQCISLLPLTAFHLSFPFPSLPLTITFHYRH